MTADAMTSSGKKSFLFFLFFFPFLFLTSVTMRKRTVVVLHSFCATVLTACVHCSQKVYTCDGGDTRVIITITEILPTFSNGTVITLQ